MKLRLRAAITAGVILSFVLRSASGLAEEPHQAAPETRAVQFLSAEVPKWASENKCHSCHNNGDAARALMAATRAGELADRAPLAETLKFLNAPADWDQDGPEGPFKDKKLARLQFAAALAEAHQSGLSTNREALAKAAELVAEMQMPDGHWETDLPGNIGSPATYGSALATAMAMRVLAGGDASKHRAALAKARLWFVNTAAESVLDAAATMLALAGDNDPAAGRRRDQCWQLIRRGQSPDGGWGPFINSPSEVFDTALVVLALAADRDRAGFAEGIERGRKYLLGAQESDGGWPATTRPSGVDSYAERISTSGWALQALLATRDAAKSDATKK